MLSYHGRRVHLHLERLVLVLQMSIDLLRRTAVRRVVDARQSQQFGEVVVERAERRAQTQLVVTQQVLLADQTRRRRFRFGRRGHGRIGLEQLTTD